MKLFNWRILGRALKLHIKAKLARVKKLAMSESVPPSRTLNHALLGAWIAKRHHIWQMDYLNADELARFSQKHGLSFFERKDITQLWQLGLLQADMIKCHQKIQYPDLIEQGIDENDEYIYSDERQFPSYPGNWEEAVAKLELLSPDIQLFFHPFRFYVLAQIESLLSRYRLVEKVQFPIQSHAVPDFLFFQRWANSDTFKEEIRKWNTIASLAIMAEPCVYESIFHSLSVRLSLDFEALRGQISKHWEDVARCYREEGIELLKEAHQEIRIATQQLDPNTDIHIILRLGSGELRLKLEGKLGGAIHLQAMAEVLRRATERALETLLPEEDERGFGEYPKDAKKHLYGSNRLFDGDRLIANEFLRQHGLVYSLRLRWYVEGDTEWGALYTFFNEREATDIEIINLRAHVAQRAGKGPAFRDSLRSDIHMHIFSFVLIDGDRSDFTSAVRKAAEDDEICGAFFIPKKDFEFENFDLLELEDILWSIATENPEKGPAEDDRQKLHVAIQDAGNGSELIDRARKALPQLAHLKKDATWGECLMKYAWERPSKQGKYRQVIEAIRYAFYLARTPELESYEAARRDYQVDKNAGRLAPRSTASFSTKKRSTLNSCR
jgi:hypothetical protein